MAKVFIAEDDAAILNLLRIRLELAGHTTLFAKTGPMAMQGIMAYRPDLVLLDIGLPIEDGFKVLSSMRASAVTARIPVMMVTARHSEKMFKKALISGAQDYVTKPFDDQKLLARVTRVISSGVRPMQSQSWSV